MRVGSFSSSCTQRSVFLQVGICWGGAEHAWVKARSPSPPHPLHPYLPSVRPSLGRAQLHFGEFSRAILPSPVPLTHARARTH